MEQYLYIHHVCFISTQAFFIEVIYNCTCICYDNHAISYTYYKKKDLEAKKKKRPRSSMHDLCYVISSFSEIMPKITGALNFNLSCLNFTMQPGIVTAICKGNIRTIEIYKRFWGSTEAVANKVQGDQL